MTGGASIGNGRGRTIPGFKTEGIRLKSHEETLHNEVRRSTGMKGMRRVIVFCMMSIRPVW